MPSSTVIDANVVKGLCVEENGGPHSLSGTPSVLFRLVVSSGVPVCMDDGGRIEVEWRQCCDADWLENWFLAFVSTANVRSIWTPPCARLIKRLRVECGFPTSRDRVLIVTSVAGVGLFGDCTLVTEDLDFYEPADKACGSRRRGEHLRGTRTGAVKRLLRNQESVHVRSVASSIPEFQAAEADESATEH
jgi:hypothetical protein